MRSPVLNATVPSHDTCMCARAVMTHAVWQAVAVAPHDIAAYSPSSGTATKAPIRPIRTAPNKAYKCYTDRRTHRSGRRCGPR